MLVFAAACSRQRSDGAPLSEGPAAHSAGSILQPSTTLLATGSPMPDVAGEAQDGQRVSLRQLVGKPVVVYFYPKDDTPGCTVEAQEIRDLWSELQSTGAVVVGVSTDDAASHRAFAEKHALPFLLLADIDHSIAKAFGVPLKNGRAGRVSFVVGTDGRVARVFPQVNPSGHGRELLTAVQAVRG